MNTNGYGDQEGGLGSLCSQGPKGTAADGTLTQKFIVVLVTSYSMAEKTHLRKPSSAETKEKPETSQTIHTSVFHPENGICATLSKSECGLIVLHNIKA